MRKAIQHGLLTVILAIGSFAAFAGGSNPGLYYGQVPTAAQWNSYFAAKLDYTPGAANTIPYWDGSGNLLNALLSGDCTSIANVVTCTIGGAGIHAATSKITPVDADEFPIADSASTPTPYGLKKLTFANLKAWEATYLANIAGSATQTFSVATATAAAHAIRSDQISTDNTNFPIYTAPATWTPTDTSGAGLTFTSVTGYITKIGKLRIARFALTFPVTADGSNVSIGGLPEAAASHGPNSIQGFFTSTSTITTRGLYGAGGASSVVIDKNNGATLAINSDFSGCIIYATLFYEVP